MVMGGENAHYVRPALCEMPAQTGPVLRETFAPILYVMRYREFDEAIRLCRGGAFVLYLHPQSA
jgi:aldehyde dehydrogenase (NAD+)